MFPCLHFSDVFQTGRWASIQTSGENLADLKFFCGKSKSESTFRKYRYAFNSWIKWCYSQSPKVQHFPASDFNVSIYLINLSKQFNSVAKVNEAFYAILGLMKFQEHKILVIHH